MRNHNPSTLVNRVAHVPAFPPIFGNLKVFSALKIFRNNHRRTRTSIQPRIFIQKR